jgi:WD40 repeat protein
VKKHGGGKARDAAPPRFRHLGYVVQSCAACLMFCFENGRPDGPLFVLPTELVLLIGRFLVAGSAVVRFAHPEKLECVAALQAGVGCVETVASFTTPGGRQFLAISINDDAATFELWDLSLRERVGAFDGHADLVTCCQTLYSDGKGGVQYLAGGSSCGEIMFWDVPSCNLVARLSAHEDSVWAMVPFKGTAGEPCLASAASDCTIKLWDVRTRTEIATLCTAGIISSLCTFRDARDIEFLVSGSWDASIRIWDLSARESVFSLPDHADSVNCLTSFTSEDGVPMLVSASDDKTFKVWDLESRVMLASMRGVHSPTSLACFAGADGRVLLAYCSDSDKEGRLLDLSTDRYAAEIEVFGVISAFTDLVSGKATLAIGQRAKPNEISAIRLWQ